MQVFIYRSRRRNETYLYLAERDDFDRVPEALLKAIEPLEFSFSFELSSGRALASEDPAIVRRNLSDAGFHLQSPRDLAVVDASSAGDADA
ncbi:MAG: YcgL domain-containing protein [Rhodanobacteraceae bacterium]|nr:YcgL domain-containing protein [Xanthomonadales bacterium]MCP5478468.1 YcgL domain-containing protein [Rhodanobacteraceae bacterium]HPF72524.1 YcgL domain-containing protein [Xanthomonadaceae bacterium]HRX98697.1 YcgL domain-containing protein [Xanthomonadaceae bacterium]